MGQSSFEFLVERGVPGIPRTVFQNFAPFALEITTQPTSEIADKPPIRLQFSAFASGQPLNDPKPIRRTLGGG
jgi:hypothetical protein